MIPIGIVVAIGFVLFIVCLSLWVRNGRVTAEKDKIISILQANFSSKEKMVGTLSERIDGLLQNISFDKSVISDLKEKIRKYEQETMITANAIAIAIVVIKMTKVKQPIKELGRLKKLLQQIHRHIIPDEIQRNSQLYEVSELMGEDARALDEKIDEIVSNEKAWELSKG